MSSNQSTSIRTNRTALVALAIAGTLLVAGSALWGGWSFAGDPASSALVVSPDRIDFDALPLGESEASFVVLTNVSDEILSVTPSVPDGPFQASTAPVQLAPGASSTFSVAFSPKSIGETQATVRFSTRDGVADISVSGVAEGLPEIHVSPHIIDFGAVAVGSFSEALITIENRGQGRLQLEGLDLYRQFEFEKDPQTEIAAGESVSLVVRFRPQRVAAVLEQLRIQSNDPKRSSIGIRAQGLGVEHAPAAAISIDPPALDFGDVAIGEEAKRIFTLRNEGTDPLTITTVTVNPPFTTSTRSRTIAPGGALTYPVTFAPYKEGSQLWPLMIYSNDPTNGLVTVSLLGSGSANPAISVEEAARIAQNRGRKERGQDDVSRSGIRFGGEGSSQTVAQAEPGSTPEPGNAPEPDAFADPIQPDEDFLSFPEFTTVPTVEIAGYGSGGAEAYYKAAAYDLDAGRFLIEGLELPDVNAALGEYFEISEITGKHGTVNELGDVVVPVEVTLKDNRGNTVTVPFELTTDTQYGFFNQSIVTATGTPLNLGTGEVTLVGLVKIPKGISPVGRPFKLSVTLPATRIGG